MHARQLASAFVVAGSEATLQRLTEHVSRGASDHVSAFVFDIGDLPYVAVFIRADLNIETVGDDVARFLPPSAIACLLRANIEQPNDSRITGRDVQPSAAVIKIKDGCAEEIERWAAKLNSLRGEAVESITRDGIFRECWFSFEHQHEHYLFGYMEKTIEGPLRQPLSSPKLSVDLIHGEFKKSWDRNVRINCRAA